MADYGLRVVGWGKIRLPWEQRRWAASQQQSRALVNALDQMDAVHLADLPAENRQITRKRQKSKRDRRHGRRGIFVPAQAASEEQQLSQNPGGDSVRRFGYRFLPWAKIIPTGSIALDITLGIGGFPRGRIVEIYGPESSGKTTIALHTVASAQWGGGIAAFIDTEHALDPDYAKRIGVDTDALLVSQPDTGEQALEIADMLIRSGKLDIIVIDSVAALVTKAEIEGDMVDSHVGIQARLMSQALRKISGELSSSGTTVIFINQLHETSEVFGSPETNTGSKALEFYASVRLHVQRIETLKEGSESVGNRTRVKVVKNKMAQPFKQVEFDILHGCGISVEGELIDVGVQQEVITQTGTSYNYEGSRLGEGREASRRFLQRNPDIAKRIMSDIYERVQVGNASSEKDADVLARRESALATGETGSLTIFEE